MELLPEIPIDELLRIATDRAHFRRLTREDLVAGAVIFEVRLPRDVLEDYGTERQDAESTQAFLPILRGWATVQIEVMETASRGAHSAKLMDKLPRVRSGRYPVPIDEMLADTAKLLGGKTAYSYFVSPIEVPCTLCDERLKFWPSDSLERHLAEKHPGSKMHWRELMPWRNPRFNKPA
jgi:hypothetical protein